MMNKPSWAQKHSIWIALGTATIFFVGSIPILFVIGDSELSQVAVLAGIALAILLLYLLEM